MRFALKLLVGVVVFQIAAALFERVAPHRIIRWYWKIVNPLWMVIAGRVPGFVLLETTGRRTGRKRRVPLGGRMENESLWLVAVHAADSHYIKNIAVNPQVRVRVGGNWKEGTATLVPEDDARRRAARVNLINSWFERVASSDLLTVRIDFRPPAPERGIVL